MEMSTGPLPMGQFGPSVTILRSVQHRFLMVVTTHKSSWGIYPPQGQDRLSVHLDERISNVRIHYHMHLPFQRALNCSPVDPTRGNLGLKVVSKPVAQMRTSTGLSESLSHTTEVSVM
jgi:hypothetical protein